MRRFLLMLFFALSFFCANAAYLKNVPVTVTQPDGTELKCFASGDEFYNYLHDAEGYTIIQDSQTGYYVYADKSNDKLVPTSLIAGKSNPANRGLKPNINISYEQYSAKRKAWDIPEQYRIENTSSGEVNHGKLNNISIFIRFSDDPEFSNTYSSINNMFNDSTALASSMYNYFKDASYNSIYIPTTFYPGHSNETIISYQDIYPRSYYQPYNATTNTNGYTGEDSGNERKEREFGLLQRAVDYINTNYPIPTNLNIDYNNDGNVDNVCFIVKGGVGAWSSLLWPHKWSIYDRDVYINGKIVRIFNFQLADATTYFTTSTMCHEMNHSLGAPDLYHYEEDVINPVGSWDLMEYNATPPQHCGAYMKWKYGNWIDDIPEITTYGTYTLNDITSSTNNCYKIESGTPGQYYVLEYRKNTPGYETALPGSGLLIYRINTAFNGNANYNPSGGIFDEVYIYRPNGTTTVNGSIDDAYFNSAVGKTDFNSTTNPNPFLTDGTIDTDFIISQIGAAGNTISFTYGPANSYEVPSNLAASVVNVNDVQLSWTGTTDATEYKIYRDEIIIGTVTTTTYTDTNLPDGDYQYSVSAVYAGGESDRTPLVAISVGITCSVLFELEDSGNNGWNNASLTASFSDGSPSVSIVMEDGSYVSYTIDIPKGVTTTLTWNGGSYDGECSFTVSYEFGGQIYASSGTPSSGVLTTFTTNCTTYNVSIDTDIENGTIIVDKTFAEQGATITVTDNPSASYELARLYYYTANPTITTEISIISRQFTMPAADVTVIAEFEILEPLSGQGTQNNPYLITSVDDLWKFNRLNNTSNGFDGKYIKLTADLDMSSLCGENVAGCEVNWTPIGNTTNRFKGHFNGGGHSISNLYINASTSDYQGLFGNMYGGSIDSLNLVNTNVKGYYYVGGVCGYNNSSTISHCSNSGSVSGYYIVGGVCGNNNQSNISNCLNSGSVSGTGGNVGGVCGNIIFNSNISNCLNSGSVSGNRSVGGVCGNIMDSSTISYCLNSGSVSGDNYVGGVCGSNNNSTISYCYYDKQMCTVDGINDSDVSGQAVGKLTTEMTGTALQNSLGTTNWTYADGMYPRVKNGAENSDAAIVAATPIFLTVTESTYETVDSVATNFTVGTGNDVTWETYGNGIALTVSGENVAIGTFGKDTLVAKKDGMIYKTVVLKVPSSPEYSISIDNVADLQTLRDGINSGTAFTYKGYNLPAGGKGIHFKLTADLDLIDVCGESVCNWVPIGNGSMIFKGHFNGSGHTISNLYINAPAGISEGLFGYVESGSIDSLNLVNTNVTGQYYVGGVCGRNTYSEISHCSNSGSVSGNYYVGGVCGNMDSSTINHCSNSGSVSGNYYVGGVCGNMDSSTINHCANSGSISGSGSIVGGVCGNMDSSTISYCLNSGSVRGNSDVNEVCGYSCLVLK